MEGTIDQYPEANKTEALNQTVVAVRYDQIFVCLNPILYKIIADNGAHKYK